MSPSLRRDIFGLIGWLALSAVVAGVGAFASIHAADFYSHLAQPTWAPPAWLFGPVWSLLYALMAIAAWLVWRTDAIRAVRTALTLYLVQLAANALWSWLFFAWHLGAVAFVDIVLLWVLIVATVIAFWRIRPLTGALLVPYLLWVSFAGVLNYAMWQLNLSALGS
ncbi:MAG: TspO/MBR family protein [Rudaea sp.]